MKLEIGVSIICANRRLAREYIAEFQRAAPEFNLHPFVSIGKIDDVSGRISAFLLDQSALGSPFKLALPAAAQRLSSLAPVIVVAAARRQAELAQLLTSGLADFVARTGNFVPIAVGLVERRIRVRRAMQRSPEATNCRSDFGEILRHEVNNPLTGILGNAEMLLARRDQLPSSALERLETIAHLAVRLRETIRRLSGIASGRLATTICRTKTSSDSKQDIFALEKPYGRPEGRRRIDAG
jgi:signal transduction histidine kinase